MRVENICPELLIILAKNWSQLVQTHRMPIRVASQHPKIVTSPTSVDVNVSGGVVFLYLDADFDTDVDVVY